MEYVVLGFKVSKNLAHAEANARVVYPTRIGSEVISIQNGGSNCKRQMTSSIKPSINCNQSPSCHFFCSEDEGYLFEKAIESWNSTKQPHPRCDGHQKLARMRVVKDLMKPSYGRPFFVWIFCVKNRCKNYCFFISSANKKTGITNPICVLFRTRLAMNGFSKATILGTISVNGCSRPNMPTVRSWLTTSKADSYFNLSSSIYVNTGSSTMSSCVVLKFLVWRWTCLTSGSWTRSISFRWNSPTSRKPLGLKNSPKVTFLTSLTRKKPRTISAPFHLRPTTIKMGWIQKIGKRLWHGTQWRKKPITCSTSKKRS